MASLRRWVWAGLLALLVGSAGRAWAQQDGDGSVTVHGELKQWHKVTLDVAGPWAKETDTEPNPFTDYRFEVTFTHESGEPSYTVPGYFAADGNAAETSATEGNLWRVHFAPDQAGRWSYHVRFIWDRHAALATREERRRAGSAPGASAAAPLPGDDASGSIVVAASDKTGRDLRAHGRLEYVGGHYLRFAGSGDYFLKAGADAPETLLGYADFDGTRANNPGKCPLKTYEPHLRDWAEGDPTWQGGKGKGLIGAINYLSSTGCNAFSFLTYNAGGDGDNVWPFVERDDKMHYDVSKLDQWGIVFDHAMAKGMYLHFKLQETENDNDVQGPDAGKAASLDGGDLGPQRRLYLREMIARYGYLLALNWNLGEENTQTTKQQRDMAQYIRDLDPYDHHIVIHTYPNQQDEIYGPLLGDKSRLTGASLQNSNIRDCHKQVVKWVNRSAEAGRPWVVAFDEPGDAHHGMPPDPGYNGWDGKGRDGKTPPTIHAVRKHVLWGTLLAGGAGVEYYFGYQLPENDLLCEDWRSRDQSWKYCDVALSFFRDHEVPFWEMANHDALIGEDPQQTQRYCFAKPGEVYLVYLPEGGGAELDLKGVEGSFSVAWFNPRSGGDLVQGNVTRVQGGGKVSIGSVPDSNRGHDWLAVIRKAD